MVLIPVFWTKYTATVRGRNLKVVPCENCSTEYLYILEREGSGVGTSVYALNDTGAAGHAQSAADDTLRSVLENDFDPVPCPACGHYQRYMFPKLMETKGMGALAVKVLLIVGSCLAALVALGCTLGHFQQPSDESFRRMAISWSVLLALGVAGLGLSLLNKYQIRRFNPNLRDQQERIAIGRSRAVTRAEFEKAQLEK
jgi:hypothetical protein